MAIRLLDREYVRVQEEIRQQQLLYIESRQQYMDELLVSHQKEMSKVPIKRQPKSLEEVDEKFMKTFQRVRIEYKIKVLLCFSLINFVFLSKFGLLCFVKWFVQIQFIPFIYEFPWTFISQAKLKVGFLFVCLSSCLSTWLCMWACSLNFLQCSSTWLYFIISIKLTCSFSLSCYRSSWLWFWLTTFCKSYELRH